MKKQHIIFDTEIIGLEKPVFLTCVKIKETQEKFAFWEHKRNDMRQLLDLLYRDDLTWIGFNSINFDKQLINAAMCGHDAHVIKRIATTIIQYGLKPWDVRRLFPMEELDFDHIDLIEVAPGVRISLKAYAGRMDSPRMVDLPYHHDKDLNKSEQAVLQDYCFNDLEETDRLHTTLAEALALRVMLSKQHGIDLRSKSDAQAAEAILKKICGVAKNSGLRPTYVNYTTPSLIKTKNEQIKELIEQTENTAFAIDKNGAPVEPEWMKDPIAFRGGLYKYGLGGLHSQHDLRLHRVATDDYGISDFDVTSYYPNILINCDLVPTMSGNKGEAFINAYKDIYAQRVAAKRAKNKVVDKSLKIALNGTFGKLGSPYSAFYAPDLLLAVTITGQLNLFCMIEALTRHKGVEILSANTDGIMVGYPKKLREKVLAEIAANTKRTGFGWEETPYVKIAMKDVNNYLAITVDGKVKAKGLYAPYGVLQMKNPTFQVCSDAAADYLLKGTSPERYIARQKRIEKFLSVRTVNGGGEQNGVPFGRLARWYMTTDELPPLRYLSNGNKVPKSDGGRLCLELPATLPLDLDKHWYVKETYQILHDIGAYE